MIQEFVDAFMDAKPALRASFAEDHPGSYQALVEAVVRVLGEDGPDADRITSINDGDYQGTLVFVIPEQGYQPSAYYTVKVSYGSCSACDTLEGIRGYSDEPVTPAQLDSYMMLALHIVEAMKEI